MKIVRINALWCSGCLYMKKVWKEVEKLYPNLNMETYDYDMDEDIVKTYNPGEILPVTIFYKDGNEQSMNLAKQIQANLNESIQKENKRVAMKLENVYIIKHVEIPISIVECGFLSNPEEEKQLLDDDYQNRLAWGIYNGIIDYFYN